MPNERPYLKDAQLLRDRLYDLHLSQRGLARVIGVNDRTVRAWAAGEYRVPKWCWICLAAIELGVTTA